MEPAQKEEENLHHGVSRELESIGHSDPTVPYTAETPLPLTNQLKQIGVDAGHIAGSTFEEVVTGGATGIRTTESRNPLRIISKRVRTMIPSKRKAA